MRPEVAAYQLQLDTLVGFVEGRVDGSALDAALSMEEMRALLGVFEDTRYPASTNAFRKLHTGANRTSLGGLVNSEGIIEQFLRQADVPCQPVKRYGNLYSLMLTAMPSYADPPIEFIIEKILPADDTLSDAAKKKLIKQRAKELFRYTDKPPRWIQGADWPIRDGRPLVFVGQIAIDAPELFHDKGTVYVFFEPGGRGFETVAQFY
jgi:hypothetical protein